MNQLVSSAKGADLFSVINHEFAHTLFGTKPGQAAQFITPLNAFEEKLRDGRGQSPQPGMQLCSSQEVCGRFSFLKEGVTFHGQNAQAVLAGTDTNVTSELRTDLLTTDPSLKALPVNKDLVHIELKNSLLSHQPFRNYSMLMEAELAMLQDLGYRIDRRNFFGYSVYSNAQNISSHAPFFERTSDGQQYKPDTYNTSPLGVGLHIYGSFNKITQNAHLLTKGEGAVGIRFRIR